MAKLPYNFALIIGAMKSGTTSLFNYLAEHPEIAPCDVKEPNFFGDEQQWRKGMAWYRNLWRWRPDRHRVALEATSHYAKRPYVPNVPERIAQVRDAEFRFIYIMRHPLDRLESHDVTIALFEGAAPLSEAIPQNTIWASQYAMQLDAYQRFGRERILLLFTEDLAADPQSVMRTVCRFLEVDPDYQFQSLHQRYHTREQYFSDPPKLWKLVRRFNLVRNTFQKVPAPIREKLRRRFSRPVKADRSRFRLTADQREFVLEQLRPDLQRLQAEYGVDVESRWGIRLDDAHEQVPS